MYMKSVLAISVLTAATLFGSVGYAADPLADAGPDSAQQLDPVAEDHPHHKHHKHHRHHRHHRHHHHHHRAPQLFVDGWYPDEVESNFLLGGEIGYVRQKEDFITRFVGPHLTPPFSTYASHSENISDGGVLFGILAGWQWRYNRLLLGVEANVDFDDTQTTHNFSFTDDLTWRHGMSGTALYKRGDIYALSFRGGYFVTPFFLPYLRAGVQVSHDEASYQVFITDSVLVDGDPFQVVRPDFSSRSKSIWGFVLGIGAEFPTYIGSSTLRFEYNFTRTESLLIEDNQLPLIGNNKFRYPQSHIGKVAWVWNFM